MTLSTGWTSNTASQESAHSSGSPQLRWAMGPSSCLPCNSTDLLPLRGPHSPCVHTQLNTDKAHSAGFITASFTRQMCEPLPVCPPPLPATLLFPPFGPVSMASYCRFISLPFLPIPPVTRPPLHHGRKRMVLHVVPRFASLK